METGDERTPKRTRLEHEASQPAKVCVKLRF